MLEVPAIAALTILVLAFFVGFEVIAKVPPLLHTPLMSGSNAISGIISYSIQNYLRNPPSISAMFVCWLRHNASAI